MYHTRHFLITPFKLKKKRAQSLQMEDIFVIFKKSSSKKETK